MSTTRSRERRAARRGTGLVFSVENTMRAAKFAISMPAETMARVARAAARSRMTRGRYIADEVWAGVRLVCEPGES